MSIEAIIFLVFIGVVMYVGLSKRVDQQLTGADRKGKAPRFIHTAHGLVRRDQ